MPNDGLDADEYAEHMELRSLLNKLRLPDDFDPYRVIRTPCDSHDAFQWNFRINSHFGRKLDQLHGNGRRFSNRSDMIRHALAVMFIIERSLSPEDDAMRSLLDPAVAWIELENQKIHDDAIDEVIKTCDEGLNPSRGQIGAEGNARRKMIVELNRVRRICESEGYTSRVQKIEGILEGVE